MEDKRFCVICLSHKTGRSGGWWDHNRKGETVCFKCYQKFVWEGHKASVKKDNDKRNPRKMHFKNKCIALKENPRKGVCLDCGRMGRTDMHHWFYLIIMPWACTIELCDKCHALESLRLGQTKSIQSYNIIALRDPKTGRFTKNKGV